MSFIEALELSKRLDGKDIVQDVNLAVNPGEVVGILGPNGSGKSTLLRMLATAAKPSSGQVYQFGKPIDDYARARRHIGYLSDSSAHFGDLTGFENAQVFAGCYGLKPAQRRSDIDSWFEYFDLASDANKKVKKYSFGMKRKLAIIQSIIHDPRILLFDEPTIGLDHISEQKFYKLVRRWALYGKAIIVATNNVHEAEQICDRVVFIHRGRLVADGSPQSLVGSLGENRLITAELVSPVAVTRNGEKHVVSLTNTERTIKAVVSSNPIAVVEISNLIVKAGGDIKRIDVRSADLGTVFMNIVGEDVSW